MAVFRGVMSRTRDSPMLHLCEERVIPPFSERVQDTLDWREKEEVTRPLSLLIKPNRNCKAESKLHNYTGLRLSLATTYLTHSFPVSLSLFCPSFWSSSWPFLILLRLLFVCLSLAGKYQKKNITNLPAAYLQDLQYYGSRSKINKIKIMLFV